MSFFDNLFGRTELKERIKHLETALMNSERALISAEKKYHELVKNISSTKAPLQTPPPPEDNKERHRNIVKAAIDEGVNISFEYDSKRGRHSKRIIKPVSLKKYEDLCVEGYCYLAQAKRTFSLNRMSQLKKIENFREDVLK